MAQATGIGGLFFRAADPAGLAAWYARHLGIDMSAGAWMQQAGPTVLAPFPADSGYFPPDRGWMLNFRVDDLDALCARLAAAGIAVTTDPAWNSAIGRFARIHDPEGNPVELSQPAGPALG